MEFYACFKKTLIGMRRMRDKDRSGADEGGGPDM